MPHETHHLVQTKSNIFHWILYDFANSIVSITFFLYFAQWIVIDQKVSDLHFNLTFTLSAFLLLLTAPITGTLLDKSWKRITGLRITTIFTALFYGLCGIMAIQQNNLLALLFFTLGLYSYLLSFTFYTPLLQDITTTKNRGIISGLGIMANYLGQLLGLVIALPFATGKLTLLGGQARAETLLPAAIIFFLLALPMLIFFKETEKKKTKTTIPAAIKETYKETKNLFLTTGVLYFLLAYFLFNDAVLTAANNFPLYLEQVWHITDTTKTYLLLATLITSALGGVLAGHLADKYGHKKTMIVILVVWLIIFPFLGLITSWPLFLGTCILLGLWFGANWAVSRSLMTCIAPPGKHNIAFAYFGLAERASSFLGPIVWGLIVTKLLHLGSTRYRIAMVSLVVFIFLGLLMLKKVKNDRPHH